MKRICAKCGKDMGGVGGSTRARDIGAFMRGETSDIPEYCERCVAEETGQPLDLGEKQAGTSGPVGESQPASRSDVGQPETSRSGETDPSPANASPALPEQEET